jgi:hypothetical protein
VRVYYTELIRLLQSKHSLSIHSILEQPVFGSCGFLALLFLFRFSLFFASLLGEGHKLFSRQDAKIAKGCKGLLLNIPAVKS